MSSLRDLIAQALRHRFWVTAFLLLACISLALASYHYVAEVFKRPILLLTGPEGSNAVDIGDTLHVRFSKEPAWKFFGRSFSVTSQQTAGAKENFERVNNDRDGVLLGIGLDGFESSPHVKGILPLGDLKLLIIANTALLDRVKRARNPDLASKSTAATSQPAFSEIANYVRKQSTEDGNPNRPRFYLGPEGSGTREIAETILDYYDLSAIVLNTDSQLGFVNAAYAVEAGDVDLAFFLAPPNSTFILELARRGTTRLVDLDQAQGLAESSAALTSAIFRTGTIDRRYPDSEVRTVSARMLIFCSDSMSENEAFWLTSAIDTFLRDDGLIRDSKPGEVAVSEEIDKPVPKLLAMTFPPHPGAKLYHEKRQPWLVASSRNSLRWFIGAILAFLGTVVSAILGRWLWGTSVASEMTDSRLPDRENRPAPAEAGSAQKSGTSIETGESDQEHGIFTPANLIARIRALKKEVDRMPRPTTHEARMKLFPRYSLLRHDADASEESGQFPDRDFDDVHAALSEMEINFFTGAHSAQ